MDGGRKRSLAKNALSENVTLIVFELMGGTTLLSTSAIPAIVVASLS